jgi:uncharacterized membrane protein YhaH (DUF805 family)
MTHAYAPALSVLLNPGMRWKSCSNSCSAPAGASIGPSTGARFSFFSAPGCSWASFVPMLVVVFIPLLAGFAVSIWGFVEIGCLRGNAGPNKYGSNPLSVPAARG